MMTKDKLRQLSGDERLGQMRESEYTALLPSLDWY